MGEVDLIVQYDAGTAPVSRDCVTLCHYIIARCLREASCVTPCSVVRYEARAAHGPHWQAQGGQVVRS